MHLLKLKQDPKKSKLISDKSTFGTKVMTYKDLIWVPPQKMNHIVKWYHNSLLHAGMTRLIKMIGTHFGWPGLQKDVKNFVNTCEEYQQFKIAGNKSYGWIYHHHYMTKHLGNKFTWIYVENSMLILPTKQPNLCKNKNSTSHHL